MVDLAAGVAALAARVATEFNNLRSDKRVDVVAIADVAQTGFQTIDGIVGYDGMRVLCVNQQPTHGAASSNGVWLMHNGVWTRDPRFGTGAKIAGAEVTVQKGDTYKNSRWKTNWSAGDTLGTDYQLWFMSIAEFGNAFQYPQPAANGHLYWDANNKCVMGWWDDFGWVLLNGWETGNKAYRDGIYWPKYTGSGYYETDTGNTYIHDDTGWNRIGDAAGKFGQFGGALPVGWLLCDGSAVSCNTYPDLYAAIGRTYGSGNGLAPASGGTFNLPNASNKTLRGNIPSVGAGSDTVSLVEGNLPQHTHSTSHSHTASTSIVTSGSHKHIIGRGTTVVAGGNYFFARGGGSTDQSDLPMGTDGDHTHSASTGVSAPNTAVSGGGNGSASAVSITNPYVGARIAIKV